MDYQNLLARLTSLREADALSQGEYDAAVESLNDEFYPDDAPSHVGSKKVIAAVAVGAVVVAGVFALTRNSGNSTPAPDPTPAATAATNTMTDEFADEEPAENLVAAAPTVQEADDTIPAATTGDPFASLTNAEWVKLRSTNPQAFYFIDRASLTDRGDGSVYWELSMNREDAGTGTYTLRRMAVECGAKKTRLFEEFSFQANKLTGVTRPNIDFDANLADDNLSLCSDRLVSRSQAGDPRTLTTAQIDELAN